MWIGESEVIPLAMTTPGRGAVLHLRLVLWAAALHSFAVGLGLILHPAPVLAYFGYAPLSEPFFPTQGGVFHVLMAVGYGMGAVHPDRFLCLVVFAVIVKTAATAFLLTYWSLVSPLWIVLLSAVGDGALAVALWWAYRRWRRSVRQGG